MAYLDSLQQHYDECLNDRAGTTTECYTSVPLGNDKKNSYNCRKLMAEKEWVNY